MSYVDSKLGFGGFLFFARKHPIVLPHKLACHPSWPMVANADVKKYWEHLAAQNSPLASISPNQDHVPLWLWGDEAQYRKGSGDEILLVCLGSVLHTEKFSVASCYPLSLCRSEAGLDWIHGYFFLGI